MVRVKNLEELKEVAIKYPVGSSVRIYNPATNTEQIWTATADAKEKTFCRSINAVVFYTKMCYYVVPRAINVMLIMAGNDFEHDSDMSHPYEGYNFPIDQREEWEWLRKDEHGQLKDFYGIISLDVMTKCYRIPTEGIEVESLDGKRDFYKPFSNEWAGYYKTEKGMVVFVYYDGDTYVSNHVNDVLPELIDKGYEHDNHLWIPFSGGECPVDEYAKLLWNLMNSCP